MPNISPDPLTYRDAGVDIDAGNSLVRRIKPIVENTFRKEVLTGLGGFGALFELPHDRYREPVLVSSTDGVGTKLKLAMALDYHHVIGIDLVAMCVNDILVTGAEPLFFLDYYATGKLDLDAAERVLTGIAKGCEQAGAALVGGETAEMPGMYNEGDYDLAGFCVGIVEKSQIIEPRRVQSGDVLIGMASSGPHSNGYSLIRKIIEISQVDLGLKIADMPLGKALLTPTLIYVRSVLELIKQLPVHAVAHITGGGLPENLPRVLPTDLKAVVDLGSWQWPEIFAWIQQLGNVNDSEMLRTFNCGVGMVLCVPAKDAQRACAILNEQGETAWPIGQVRPRNADESSIEFV